MLPLGPGLRERVQLGAEPLAQLHEVGNDLGVELDLLTAGRLHGQLAGGEQDRERAARLVEVAGDIVSLPRRRSANVAEPGWPRVMLRAVDARERRMAQNEALFREVNERVQDAAEQGAVRQYEYFCECANVDCTFRVTLSPAEYEAVRADAKQFVVLPDHYTPEVEDLVAQNDAFWVVRKSGEAGEYVENLDPRSR